MDLGKFIQKHPILRFYTAKTRPAFNKHFNKVLTTIITYFASGIHLELSVFLLLQVQEFTLNEKFVCLHRTAK